MAQHDAAKPSLVLQDATSSDIDKLAPIFSRSFHPTSEYMRKAVPNTPATLAWWTSVHAYALYTPNIRLTKVIDTHTNAPVALCRWRIHDAEAVRTSQALVETWATIPLPADADAELCNAFIEFQHDARAKWVGNRPHVLVELVLTADEYKGKGAGRLMIEGLCREADALGLECFIETNGPVVKFYERFGFVLKESVGMPGGYGYTENILVRPAKGLV